jgi:hypothetical protein
LSSIGVQVLPCLLGLRLRPTTRLGSRVVGRSRAALAKELELVSAAISQRRLQARGSRLV